MLQRPEFRVPAMISHKFQFNVLVLIYLPCYACLQEKDRAQVASQHSPVTSKSPDPDTPEFQEKTSPDERTEENTPDELTEVDTTDELTDSEFFVATNFSVRSVSLKPESADPGNNNGEMNLTGGNNSFEVFAEIPVFSTSSEILNKDDLNKYKIAFWQNGKIQVGGQKISGEIVPYILQSDGQILGGKGVSHGFLSANAAVFSAGNFYINDEGILEAIDNYSESYPSTQASLDQIVSKFKSMGLNLELLNLLSLITTQEFRDFSGEATEITAPDAYDQDYADDVGRDLDIYSQLEDTNEQKSGLSLTDGPDLTSDNFYKILGVNSDADLKTIKKSYRNLALKHHPDRKTGSEEMFKKIGRSYEILKDTGNRKAYDSWLSKPAGSRPAFDNNFLKSYKQVGEGAFRPTVTSQFVDQFNTVHRRFSNGLQTRTWSNGVVDTFYANGVMNRGFPPPANVREVYFPDKTVRTYFPNGDSAFRFSNGISEYRFRNGMTQLNVHGTPVRNFWPGSVEFRQGNLISIQRNGKVLFQYDVVSKNYWAPAGNAFETRASILSEISYQRRIRLINNIQQNGIGRRISYPAYQGNRVNTPTKVSTDIDLKKAKCGGKGRFGKIFSVFC